MARVVHEPRPGIYRPGAKNTANYRQPVRHEVVTYVLGTNCYLCLRVGHEKIGDPGRTSGTLQNQILKCEKSQQPGYRRSTAYTSEFQHISHDGAKGIPGAASTASWINTVKIPEEYRPRPYSRAGPICNVLCTGAPNGSSRNQPCRRYLGCRMRTNKKITKPAQTCRTSSTHAKA